MIDIQKPKRLDKINRITDTLHNLRFDDSMKIDPSHTMRVYTGRWKNVHQINIIGYYLPQITCISTTISTNRRKWCLLLGACNWNVGGEGKWCITLDVLKIYLKTCCDFRETVSCLLPFVRFNVVGRFFLNVSNSYLKATFFVLKHYKSTLICQ